jgi:hypothetical protein
VLQDIVTGNCLDYHVDKLRPFLFDERTQTPLQVALTDTLDEFVVEKVISMTGNTRQSRKHLQFRIRWSGYGEADDTIESWDNVKDSFAVQAFLRAHPEKRIQRLAKPIETPDQDVKDDSSIDEE